MGVCIDDVGKGAKINLSTEKSLLLEVIFIQYSCGKTLHSWAKMALNSILNSNNFVSLRSINYLPSRGRT